jgi:hypothetical protein
MKNDQRARRATRLQTVCTSLSLLLLAGTVLAGCAAMTRRSPPVITMSPGWESRFTVDWRVEPESGATRRIKGFLNNQYGDAFTVQVAAHGLDASGGIVWQRVQRMFGTVPPFERDYFEFAGLPAADQYLVTVYSYNPIQSGGNGSRDQ